jgi:hypothetical protein
MDNILDPNAEYWLGPEDALQRFFLAIIFTKTAERRK